MIHVAPYLDIQKVPWKSLNLISRLTFIHRIDFNFITSMICVIKIFDIKKRLVTQQQQHLETRTKLEMTANSVNGYIIAVPCSLYKCARSTHLKLFVEKNPSLVITPYKFDAFVVRTCHKHR